MDCILSPHIDLLTALLDWTPKHTALKADPVPVLAFAREAMLHSRLPAERQGMVSYAGNLTIIERAQIINWFATHIPRAEARKPEWITGVPIAHAYTLILASRLYEEELEASSDNEGLIDDNGHPFVFTPNSDLLQRAWQLQVSKTNSRSYGIVDVDRECIAAFEERLFECSERAGLASFYQWGLDVGDHQSRWNPFNEVPYDWDYHDYEWEYEDECEVNTQLICQVADANNHDPRYPTVSPAPNISMSVHPPR